MLFLHTYILGMSVFIEGLIKAIVLFVLFCIIIAPFIPLLPERNDQKDHKKKTGQGSLKLHTDEFLKYEEIDTSHLRRYELDDIKGRNEKSRWLLP